MSRISSGLLLLFLAPILASAQLSASNTACTGHYVVQSGDTCDTIGQKTSTSTYQIMALNLPEAGPNCYTLNIGVQLCLGNYGNDCQLVHRVTSSDSCDSITAQYSISQATLLNNNPNIDCNSIYDGLVLCASQGSIRPPAPAALAATFSRPYDAAADVNATLPLGTAIVPAHTLQNLVTVANRSTAASAADTKQNLAADVSHGHRSAGHHHFASGKKH